MSFPPPLFEVICPELTKQEENKGQQTLYTDHGQYSKCMEHDAKYAVESSELDSNKIPALQIDNTCPSTA